MTFWERPIKKRKKPSVEINWKIHEMFSESASASEFENTDSTYSSIKSKTNSFYNPRVHFFF